jgi:hypothetical protein
MAYTTINKGSSYFNTVLYTGNGATQSVTGVGFKPDFVWIKGRSFADHHTLNDSVRGVNKQLYSNLTFGEGTAADCLTAFNTDGFSVGLNVIVNQSASTFVAWNWLASNTTTSNTSGTISSTVSVNTTAGFSVVSFTGNGSNDATIGHGLGTTPAMIITKNRSDSVNWRVWHKDLTADNVLFLASTLGEIVPAGQGNGYIKTVGSSTYSVYQGNTDTNGVNGSGDGMITYCFANVKGYSKFGSYIGNGNANGTFVYTGFKPAFIMYKQISADGESWIMQDGARDLFNVTNKRLLANANNAEADEPIDFLSNGFKCRTTGAFQNASGSKYIYMCFASNPFVTSTQIPVTAR